MTVVEYGIATMLSDVGGRRDKLDEAHRRIKHVRNEDDRRWLTGILLDVMGENRQVYRERRRPIPDYPL